MITSSRGTDTLSTRAFRLLIGLYPAAFRDEYGRELALVFADRYRDAPGRWDRSTLWVEALAGIVVEAPKEHSRMILQDLKFALRLLVKDLGFTITTVATLALCLAGNTAIFSIINSVVLKPLPFPEPERIVSIGNEYPRVSTVRGYNGVPDYFDRLNETTTFEAVSLLLKRRYTA